MPPRTLRPGLVLAITAGAAALTGIGLSSISVLFPELRRAFPGTSSATLSWVANVFTIVGAATLIPAGALADRAGKKRMVLIGVAMFVVGSLCGALAPNPGWLIAARLVQALGASCYTPATAALLMASYPPERIANAIGVWSVTGGLSAAIGPPLAGLLVKVGDWRTTFWFNVPLGLVMLVLGARYLQESDRERTRAIPDPIGTLLVIAGVSPIVYALVKAGVWGWLDRRTLGWIGLGLAISAVFVWRCARHHNPLVDLTLFRFRSVRVANIGTFVIAASWFCVYWAIIQYITTAWHWTPVRAGLVTAPVSLTSGLLGLTVGKLAPRTGHRVFILPGAVLFIATAVLSWIAMGTTPSVWRVAVISGVMGMGSGCVFPSFIAIAVIDVKRTEHAVATGINFMSQRIGTTIGVALAIAFVSSPGADPLDGLRRAFAVTVASAILAFLVGLTVGDTRRSAH